MHVGCRHCLNEKLELLNLLFSAVRQLTQLPTLHPEDEDSLRNVLMQHIQDYLDNHVTAQELYDNVFANLSYIKGLLAAQPTTQEKPHART